MEAKALENQQLTETPKVLQLSDQVEGIDPKVIVQPEQAQSDLIFGMEDCGMIDTLMSDDSFESSFNFFSSDDLEKSESSPGSYICCFQCYI